MSARLAYLRLADEFESRRKENRNNLVFALVWTLCILAIVIINHQWWWLIAVAFGALWGAGSRWLMRDYERQRDRALDAASMQLPNLPYADFGGRLQ